jgi:DNA-binding SARP family transcriptional activator
MDVLLDALWPRNAPDVARHKLHCAFSALRRSLNNGYTDRKGGGYLLCREGTYELTHHSGRQASGSATIAHYEAVCSLYKDPLLSEDLYADWSLPHREQLETIYLTMCRTLAAHYLATAQPEEAAADHRDKPLRRVRVPATHARQRRDRPAR